MAILRELLRQPFILKWNKPYLINKVKSPLVDLWTNQLAPPHSRLEGYVYVLVYDNLGMRLKQKARKCLLTFSVYLVLCCQAMAWPWPWPC